MVSGFIGNEVPRKGLRVRIPCPPLKWLGPQSDKKRRSLTPSQAYGVFFGISLNVPVFCSDQDNGKRTTNLLP